MDDLTIEDMVSVPASMWLICIEVYQDTIFDHLSTLGDGSKESNEWLVRFNEEIGKCFEALEAHGHSTKHIDSVLESRRFLRERGKPYLHVNVWDKRKHERASDCECTEEACGGCES